MIDDRQLEAKAAAAPHAWSDAQRSGWALALCEVLIVVAGLALLWPTTASLFVKWEPVSNSTYGHGYLVLAICFWLLLRGRTRLEGLAPQPNLFAAALLVPLAAVWVVASRASIEFAHQMLVPAFLWLGVCAALGLRIAWRSTFAIGYLLFALPLWDLLTRLLQWATVVAAEVLLSITHVNAYVEGNFVHLAAGVFEIAGGCSGLNFFIVALAIAALYGEIGNDSPKVRLKFVLLAAALAMVTNWIRVYCIIVAGYLTDMQHYLVRVEHYRFGWAMFAVAMVVFFVIVRGTPVSNEQTAPAVDARNDTNPAGTMLRGLSVAFAALALGPAWNMLVPVSAATAPPRAALLPSNPGHWSGPVPVGETRWKPVFTGADLVELGEYSSAGNKVLLYSAVYLSQVQDKELIGYDNTVSGKHVEVIERTRVATPVPMMELTIEDEAGRAVVRYFYQVERLTTTQPAAAALSYGVQSLTGSPLSRVVAARAECAPDCGAARAALDDVLQAAQPALLSIPNTTGRVVHD